MNIPALLQLISSCLGIIGSLFFALGALQLNAKAIANLSIAYHGPNPHIVKAYAEQKTQYLFGAVLILAAFFLQLVSGVVPSLTPSWLLSAANIYLVVILASVVVFLFGIRATPKMAARMEKEVKKAAEDTTDA